MKPGASVCGVATSRCSFLVLLTEAHFVTLRASPPPRSFAPTERRTDGGRGPSVQPGTTAVDRRPRVRSGPAAAAAPLLQIITRDFLTISAVRPSALAAAACAMLARAPRTERKGAAARDHPYHLLNGKKRTWPQSIRTKQRSCRFWPSFRHIHLSIWFSFHITAAAGSDR